MKPNKVISELKDIPITKINIKNDLKVFLLDARNKAINRLEEKYRKLANEVKHDEYILSQHNLSQPRLEKPDFYPLDIPLPLCMLLDHSTHLSSQAAWYGWQQLFRCTEKSSSDVLLNENNLFFEKMNAFNKYMIELNKESLICSNDIQNAINKKLSGSNNYLIEKQLKKFEKEKIKILSNFFNKIMMPLLANYLFSLTLEKTKMLLRNFTEDVLSIGTELISFCLNAQTPKAFKFSAVMAEKNIVNIDFPSADKIEFSILYKNLFVQAFNFKNELVRLDINAMTPSHSSMPLMSPQLLVQLNPISLSKKITTDSIAVAKIFFKSFCRYQLALHPTHYHTLFARRSSHLQRMSHQNLNDIYSNLLKNEISDEEILILFKICSHFRADPKCVDDFFTAAIKKLPALIKIIEDTLSSQMKDLDTRIDLRCYDPKTKADVLKTFNDFLNIQQRNPALTLSVSSDENWLLLDNFTLCGLREMITSNKVVCRLIQFYCNSIHDHERESDYEFKIF